MQGIHFLRRQPVILSTMTLDMVAVLFGGVVALLPIFARQYFPNSPEQADLQIGTSEDIVQMHKDRKALITDLLSTLVLEATGALIFRASSAPTGPVLWLNHDIVARQLNQLHA